MNGPQALVGKYVALQFARPLYFYEYGAHVGGGVLPAPMLESQSKDAAQSVVGADGALRRPEVPMKQVTRDQAIGKLIAADDGYLTIELTVPRLLSDGNIDEGAVVIVHKTVRQEIILSCDAVVDVEAPVPQAAVLLRAPQTKSKLHI